MRHKHADVIHAWADGAKVEIFDECSGHWYAVEIGGFSVERHYRIKPAPTADEQTDNHSGICLEVVA